MSDVDIRTEGRAGRITLTREKALNALTWDMVMQIEDALIRWRSDDAIALVIIDAEGPKAFCAGGDIAQIYATGTAGDYGPGRQFWRDEYRLNAMIAGYDKPIIALMQGFVMGGGVGIGGHASHRVVDDGTRVALPECGIGLVPDVGSTLLLARAPGRLGEYIGLTGQRMDAGDAIYAGFADHLIPQEAWSGLILKQPGAVPPAPITHAFDLMERNSPLSMACTLQIVRAVRAEPNIHTALTQEFRFTFRSQADSDFLEGIRAAIIDRDRTPKWRHTSWDVPATDIAALTAPLGPDALYPEISA
jgi:enoyl-CoA hydratase/carnithine racemase